MTAEPVRTRRDDALTDPLLRELLETQSFFGQEDRMTALVATISREAGATVEIDAGNVYATRGLAGVYPCVIAHTDTVFPIVADDRYAVRFADGEWWASDATTGQPRGIGGDDKVGIWIALSVLRTLPAAKAAFFHSEEVGRLGSRAARMDFFADAGFVLQADRRGSGEFVSWIYDLDLHGDDFSARVAPILAQYGFRETPGRSTDVLSLADNGVGVAVANVACGYYQPHTQQERIVHAEAVLARDLVLRICREFGGVRFPHRLAAAID